MKKYDSTISLLFAGMLVSALLAGCSGGGSSSSAAAGQTQTPASIVVTPSLGKFSSGAAVNLKKIDGTLIASGTIAADGTSTITLPVGYTGPIVIEVLGGAGVTYYDEKGGSTPNFSAGQKLRAVMPSVKSTVGVTPLTNAAVAILETGGALTGATAESISLANTKLAAAFGLSDILLAPTPVSSATGATLNIAKLEDKYALVLAALAKTATTGSDAAAVAAALALDMKDDKLDGMDATIATPTVTLAAYTPATIVTEYQNAATTLMDSSSQAVVVANPLVMVADVSAIVTAPNQTDVDLAKGMFAELRTTATSLSNVTKTGFLDTQAASMSGDLTASVGPNTDKVLNRIYALGYAAESLKDFNNSYLGFSNALDPTTGGPAMARSKGSINDAMYGGSGVTYCWSANPAPISAMSCIIAGSGSGAVDASGQTYLKMLKLDITQSGPNTYSYAATRVNLPVYFDLTTYQWQANGVLNGSGTTGAIPVPSGALIAGSGSYTGTVDANGDFLSGMLTGTMPPSSLTSTGTAATGLDHFGITVNRTALTTPATSYHITIVGTVSSDNLVDATKTNAAFSFDAGTYLDMQKTTVLDAYGQTIGNVLGGKVIGTMKTAATQFTGSIDFGPSVRDASNSSNMISSATATGSLSDISAGGVGEILTGKVAMTEVDANLFNVTLPISSTNYQKQSVTFTGTVQQPNRPLMTLVLTKALTGFGVYNETLNYTYGTVSISGNRVYADVTPLNYVVNLSNQDGIAVVITSAPITATPWNALITGAVSKSGSPVASFTSATGLISYVDGFSETLN